jgi:hypothetical protein
MAGRFYPADPGQCRAIAEAMVRAPQEPASVGGLGGIVPHAGWICSGAIAGQTLGTLARGVTPDVVVVFGAIHTPIDVRVAALGSHQSWAVPGDNCPVSRELAATLERTSDLFATDDRLHAHEHAVEVELPLIRVVWPDAQVLPVEVPVVESAAEMGRRTARLLLDKGHHPVFLASSDLTHYGPSYRFAPAGIGIEALNWAKENDRRLLRRVEAAAPAVGRDARCIHNLRTVTRGSRLPALCCARGNSGSRLRCDFHGAEAWQRASRYRVLRAAYK